MRAPAGSPARNRAAAPHCGRSPSTVPVTSGARTSSMSPGVSRRTPGVRERPPEMTRKSFRRSACCGPGTVTTIATRGYRDTSTRNATTAPLAGLSPGRAVRGSGAAEETALSRPMRTATAAARLTRFTALLADQVRRIDRGVAPRRRPRTQRRQWSGIDRIGLPPHPASPGPPATTNPGVAAGQRCRRPKYWPRPRNSTPNPPDGLPPRRIWAGPGHFGPGAAQMNARAGMVSSVNGTFGCRCPSRHYFCDKELPAPVHPFLCG